DVVGLDVQVHARGMVDLLHFDVQVSRRVAEPLVLGAVQAGVLVDHRRPQRASPERGRRVEVVDVAVDDEACEAAAVCHGYAPVEKRGQLGSERSSSSALRKRAASPPVAARWSKVSEIGMRRCTSMPPITATTSLDSLPAPTMATVGGTTTGVA